MKKLLLMLLLLGIGPPALLAQLPASPFSGTITGSACLTVPTGNKGTVTFQITGGSWTGTIQPEGTIDGNASFNVLVVPFQSTTTQGTITANGIYTLSVAGLDSFKLCGNTVTNTATVKGNSVQVVSRNSPGGGGAGGDAATLEGHTWEAPGTIGSTTPNTGAFTTLTFNNAIPPVNVDPAVIAAIDNSIQSSAVDANGAPSFITTAAATLAIPINGGTTTLAMFIGGKQMKLTTNVTKTLVSGLNYIYAVGDTANAASLVAADFASSTIPLSYSYAAPVCSNGSNTPQGNGSNIAAASVSNPHYWFNMSTNQMNICTSSGGAFTATSYGGANSPAILIGVAWSGGTNVDAVAPMPFAASPIQITRNFGDGSSGAQEQTGAGTLTRDGLWQTTGMSVITGGFSETQQNTGGTNQPPGLIMLSQNPVIIFNGSFSGTGKGRAGSAGGTGAASGGGQGAYGGSGGGGGGSTTNAGGSGGGKINWFAFGAGSVAVASGGTTAPTAGGNGANAVGNIANTLPPKFFPWNPGCMGATGGTGGGDSVNASGGGGAAGVLVSLAAPTVSISGTGIVSSDGVVGGAAAGGNSGGGGGGGGGCAIVSTFMPIGFTAGTNITAAGGGAGAKAGTGAVGGTGGTGIVQINRLQ